MQTWQPLKIQDKVRIIAPSSQNPSTTEATNAWQDLEKCCDILREWGLEPVYSPQLFAKHKSYYNFANTDSIRYHDFVDAFQSDVKAIWAFRGGYGSDRVLAAVEKNQIQPQGTKLFIGFSDVTNIHSYLNSRWKTPSLHAASLRQVGLRSIDEQNIQTTREIIFGEKSEVTLTLKPLNAVAKQDKTLDAIITGGNLTIVQAALGTPWQPQTENTILLLEDVGEAPYRIARILQQFLANGFLKTTKAILFGDFIPEEDMVLALQEFAEQTSIPVLRNTTIGHGKQNYPIPLGTNTRLVLGETAQLHIETR